MRRAERLISGAKVRRGDCGLRILSLFPVLQFALTSPRLTNVTSTVGLRLTHGWPTVDLEAHLRRFYIGSTPSLFNSSPKLEQNLSKTCNIISLFHKMLQAIFLPFFIMLKKVNLHIVKHLSFKKKTSKIPFIKPNCDLTKRDGVTSKCHAVSVVCGSEIPSGSR